MVFVRVTLMCVPLEVREECGALNTWQCIFLTHSEDVEWLYLGSLKQEEIQR